MFMLASFPAFSFASWDVVLEDSYKDTWRLNRNFENSFAYFFSGKWEAKVAWNRTEEHSASAMIVKQNGMMVLSGFYWDGDVCYTALMPQQAWGSSAPVTQLSGWSYWVRDTQYRNSITLKVVQGALPSFTVTGSALDVPIPGAPDALVAPFAQEATERKPQPLQLDDPNAIYIGALLPLSGPLASLGVMYQAALELAEEDINLGMQLMGEQRRVEFAIRDTETSPSVTDARLFEFYQQGLPLTLGPEDSASVDFVLNNAIDNGLLLLSSSSTAAALAQEDNNLFRLMPNDANQARAIVDRLVEDGVTDLVIFSRSDIYGYGLLEAVINEYEFRGGTVVEAYFNPPRESIIPSVMKEITGVIEERIEAVGADRVGFLMILFDEGLETMRIAAKTESLGQIRWYGTDSLALNAEIRDDQELAQFAMATRFVCTQLSVPRNPLYEEIEQRIQERLGVEGEATPITPFAVNLYDAARLAAQVLLVSDGGDIETLKANLRRLALDGEGPTFPIQFDRFDDRAQGDYGYWGIVESDGEPAWYMDSIWPWTEPTRVEDWAVR